MNYRADIDGLRAWAVVPVILFHAGFDVFSGGYVGVDVFFVISGYLITSIITAEIAKNKFSIVGFYERRARRILPALLFYVVVALVFAVVIYPPHMLKDFGQSLVANSFFLSNVFFYIETDYFNDFSETAPLLHTWSLSVEEQYYIVIPILLAISLKLSIRLCFSIVACLVMTSLAFSEFMLSKDPAFSFYMLPSRFWELGVGSLLAWVCNSGRVLSSGKLGAFLAFLGLLLILLSVLLFDADTKFPGLVATVPVIGTSLVIAFSRDSSVVHRFLSWSPLVFVGLISYSWYLSHHIVFALVRVSHFQFSDIYVTLFSVLVSFLLALFSWRFVEKPFRKKDAFTNFGVLAVSVFALLSFSAVGYSLHKTHGLREYKLANIDASLAHIVLDFPSELKARQKIWDAALRRQSISFNSIGNQSKVLILGDSKSEDFFVSTQHGTDLGVEFRRMKLDETCMSYDVSELKGDCLNHFKQVVDSEVYGDAEAVVLAATWKYNLNDSVVRFVDRLIHDRKQVFVVSIGNFSDISSLSYVIAKDNLTIDEEQSFIFDNVRTDWRRQYMDLKSKIESNGDDVYFIERLDSFCDFEKSTCKLRDEDGWYIYDSGHLTQRGAIVFGNRIRELGWFDKLKQQSSQN